MVQNKLCPKCNKNKLSSYFDKDNRTTTKLSCYCKDCKKILNDKFQPKYKHKQKEYQRKFYILNKEKVNKDSNERWRNQRIKCLYHYSNGKMNCACCGESNYEFLSIDHINGGGNKHIKSIGGKLVRWLIKNNFPQGFRVLCFNCNLSLGHHGYCPHEK